LAPRSSTNCGAARARYVSQITRVPAARGGASARRYGLQVCAGAQLLARIAVYAAVLNSLFNRPCAVTLEIQYNTIQYNTIQHNTIQHNTIQYNTKCACDTGQTRNKLLARLLARVHLTITQRGTRGPALRMYGNCQRCRGTRRAAARARSAFRHITQVRKKTPTTRPRHGVVGMHATRTQPALPVTRTAGKGSRPGGRSEKTQLCVRRQCRKRRCATASCTHHTVLPID
jgi:hypothetical protein